MSRGYFGFGLFAPQYDCNVGGVLRAAQCYGAAFVAIEGGNVAKFSTDTTRAYRHMPVYRGELRGLIPYDCVPVAVDLLPDAESLHTFVHPQRAFYIFGPENGTLVARITDWCPRHVYVPMITGCMNLAATANVIAYDRACKASNTKEGT